MQQPSKSARETGANESSQRESLDDLPDFRGMTQGDLDAEIVALRVEIDVICEDMDAHKSGEVPRDKGWFQRAARARSYKRAYLRAAESEAARRRGEVFPDPRMSAEIEAARAKEAAAQARGFEESARAEAERQRRARVAEEQRAIAARKAEAQSAKAARVAANDIQRVVRGQMFVQAARRVLGADEIERIWSLAEEMFPGHPVWTSLSKDDDAETLAPILDLVHLLDRGNKARSED